jgi:hypothetical protein
MTVLLPAIEAGSPPAQRPSPAQAGAGIRASESRRRPVLAQQGGRRLSPGLRKAIVAAHVLVGVGWFGIVLAKLVLEIVAATMGDQDVARTGYLFMGTLDRVVFPPAAIATLVTGIVLSVGTAWGLFRYWWIVVKLVLTVGVVVSGIVFVGAWTEEAIAATDAELAAASLWLIGSAAVHALMLGAATVISVFKPWGRIRPDHQEVVRRQAPA